MSRGTHKTTIVLPLTVYEALKRSAAINYRSLNGELLAVLSKHAENFGEVEPQPESKSKPKPNAIIIPEGCEHMKGPELEIELRKRGIID